MNEIGINLFDIQTEETSLEEIFVKIIKIKSMNLRGIRAIYIYEMNRSLRTLIQSLVSPVLSTMLYFIVFGAAIGSRMENISNVSYGEFIVPGLIMLTVQMQSVNNASFGIYFPKFIGTTYELLSAPLSFVEIVLVM